MQFEPIVIGWLVSSALLGAEHIGMADQPWRVEAPWSYIIGLVTVLIGCFVWSRAYVGLIAPTDAVLAFFLISTSGGWVMLGYAIRARIALRKKARQLAEEAQKQVRDLIGEGHGRKP